MEYETLVRMTTQGLLICLYVSLPVVIVSSVCGLLISFLQAVTSLQDQTISFGVKLIAVVVTLVILAPWGASTILRYAKETLAAVLPS